MNFNVYAYAIEPYTKLPATLKRKSPLGLDHPISIKHSTSVHFPEEIDYDTKDSDALIDDDAFNYKLKVKYSGKTLKLSHEYFSKQDSVSPEKVDAHIKHLKSVNQNLSYSGYLSNILENQKTQSANDLVKQFFKMLIDPN